MAYGCQAGGKLQLSKIYGGNLGTRCYQLVYSSSRGLRMWVIQGTAIPIKAGFCRGSAVS